MGPHFVFFLAFLGLSQSQSLVESLLKLLAEGEQQGVSEPRDAPQLLPEYDFIIVGAGTAGCVLANRLSEIPHWNVLLIEAGQTENYLMDLPILVNYLQFTDSNWKYKTQPSGKYCMGLDNQQCNYPRGKVMGGSSVLNYMIYTRGNHRDYDHWADLGNTGWSYEEVLPYFKKIEDFKIDEFFDPKYHAKGGYLPVGYGPFHTKIAEAVVESAQNTGLNYVDYNGEKQVGVSYLQLSIMNGTRASSSRTYLHPIRNRPNLHVRKQGMVSKILIDPTTKQATGVEFIKNGRKHQMSATKEVLISAGAINSPQLLMLSGIGPKKHLTSLGIPVVKNLKVGYNLMDHVAVGGLTFLIDQPYSLRTEKLIQTPHMVDYFSYHNGPLSIPGGCEVLTFHDVKNPDDPDGYPDLELLFQGGSVVSDALLRRDFGITDEIFDAVFKPIENSESWMVLPMLLRPKSKGRIMLSSNSYKSKPYIYPNYFAYKEDLDTLVEGVKIAINISEQAALRRIGTKLHKIPIPQCASHGFGSDEYWGCMARHFTFTIYHQSGTCKMGPIRDKRAVVDPRLRVYGIKGLRVIDASVIPEIPAAHTNAPTFMIAEKGADMIKQDWGLL